MLLDEIKPLQTMRSLSRQRKASTGRFSRLPSLRSAFHGLGSFDMGAKQALLSSPPQPTEPPVDYAKEGAAIPADIAFGKDDPVEAAHLAAAREGANFKGGLKGTAAKSGLLAMLGYPAYALKGAVTDLTSPFSLAFKGLNQVAPFAYAAKTGAEQTKGTLAELGITDPNQVASLINASQAHQAFTATPTEELVTEPEEQFSEPAKTISEQLTKTTARARPLSSKFYSKFKQSIKGEQASLSEPQGTIADTGTALEEGILTEMGYYDEPLSSAVPEVLPAFKKVIPIPEPPGGEGEPQTIGGFVLGTSTPTGEEGDPGQAELGTIGGHGLGPGLPTGEMGVPGVGDPDGDKVLCTELHRQGLLDDKIYKADSEYAKRIDPVIVEGYHWWAKPLVKRMQRSRLLTNFLAPFIRLWAQRMAFKMQVANEDSRLGAVLEKVGMPVCRLIGKIKRKLDLSRNNQGYQFTN